MNLKNQQQKKTLIHNLQALAPTSSLKEQKVTASNRRDYLSPINSSEPKLKQRLKRSLRQRDR